jgi:hypothetical protein
MHGWFRWSFHTPLPVGVTSGDRRRGASVNMTNKHHYGQTQNTNTNTRRLPANEPLPPAVTIGDITSLYSKGDVSGNYGATVNTPFSTKDYTNIKYTITNLKVGAVGARARWWRAGDIDLDLAVRGCRRARRACAVHALLLRQETHSFAPTPPPHRPALAHRPPHFDPTAARPPCRPQISSTWSAAAPFRSSPPARRR